MKLTSLHLERFGARSNLQLDQLSEHVNVIYGPNGSGKTTLIHFIRWILFGAQDSASRRYLAGESIRAAGSLGFLDGRRSTQVVTRRDDGSPRGQVRIEEVGGRPVVDYDLGRLTGIQLPEYCQVFSVSFDQPPSVDELVRLAIASGFELTYDERQLQHVQMASDQLADRRDRLQRLSLGELSRTVLEDRLRQVQGELEEVQRRKIEHLHEIDRSIQEAVDQLRQQQQQRADLETIARRTDQQIQLRQQQLEEVSREAAQLRRQWLEQRRQEMAEIDYQVDQWHRLLETLRQRQDTVRSRAASWEPEAVAVPASDEAEVRSLLRGLGYQIDDVEQDLQDALGTDSTWGQRDPSDYLRSVLGTALHSMRSDVQRLYRELQQQRSATLYHDHARELSHLRRCELELTELIDVLSRRRRALMDPSVEGTVAPSQEVVWGEPALDQRGDRSAWYLAADDFTAPRTSLTDPVLQARLQYLSQRRDYLSMRMRELDSSLDAHQQRVDLLRASREHLEEDRQIQVLQKDLAAIGEQLRGLDERQRILDEIQRLEREIDQMRGALQPSQMIQEASSYLQGMTDGALVRVRITDRREVWVEDHSGAVVRYTELSRGARDQVYLSLCLAAVSAYRRRGVELPLILNDAFTNIDTQRTRSTARELSQFAQQGHQLLVFTRHEHVLPLFPERTVRTYRLRERSRPVSPVVERPMTPVVATETPPPRVEPRYLDRVAVAPVPPASVPPPPIDRPETQPARRETHYDWVVQWDPPRGTAPGRTVGEEPVAGEPWRTTPREETRLAELSLLDASVVRRLQELGICTVRQFLEWNPDEAEQRMAQSDISAADIYRWQSNLSLQCHVGLSANDASLLVACGVDDPEELSYIDVTELHRRIDQYLSTSELRAQYGSISRFERSRLARWIESARRSRYRRYRARSNGAGSKPPSGAPRAGYRRTLSEPREPVAGGPVEATVPVATEPVVKVPRAEETTPSSEEPLRFFLEPTDPVVDAPSIGPKTAERLQGIGLHTVADLLAADPEKAAEQINYRRITSELIGNWQRQTRLVCRTPNLRGHDAQILVACGHATAEQVAAADPQSLVEQVQRFVRTAEGKRILRNSPAPDLAEVTSWVRWAKRARP